jgi:uncharacterized membrane protein
MTIKSPPEWGWEQVKLAAHGVGTGIPDEEAAPPLVEDVPEVRQIGFADLKEALARGWDDFGASRADVAFLCVIYPVIGLVLARAAFGYNMLPLVFPMAAGFALLGPLAAIGLYEMSRRRERGVDVTWKHAFGVVGAPSIGAIVHLGVLLLLVFVVWLLAARAIYDATLGPEAPASLAAFAHDVLATSAGWTMIIVGMGVGFLFAVVVLAISVVSFPMLLDRHTTMAVAIRTSVRAVMRNPLPMAAWGLIVAAGLVLGSLPVFLGLIVVLPVLGHATWHLYRHVVPR